MPLFIRFTIEHWFQIRRWSESWPVGTLIPISDSVIMVEGKIMVMMAAGRVRKMMMVSLCFQSHPSICYPPESLIHWYFMCACRPEMETVTVLRQRRLIKTD